MKRTLITALLLAGCGQLPQTNKNGSDTSTNTTVDTAPAPATDEPLQSFAVQDVSKLPACDTAREGALAEIKNESRFVTCTAGTWDSADLVTGAVTTIDAGDKCPTGGTAVENFLDKNGNGLKDDGEPTVGKITYICNGANGQAGAQGSQGAQGQTGATGATGTAGANGSNGTDNHISTRYLCDGVTQSSTFIGYGTAPSMHARYEVVITAAGDVNAKGYTYQPATTASYSTYNYGTAQESDGTIWTQIYAGADAGAGTAVVSGTVGSLVPGGNQWDATHGQHYYLGTWTFTLNQAAGSASAVYSDQNLQGESVNDATYSTSATTMTFPLTCTKTTY